MSKETKKDTIEAVIVEETKEEPKCVVKIEENWWDKTKRKAKQLWNSKPVRVGRKIARYGSCVAVGAIGLKVVQNLFGGGDDEDNPEYTTSDPDPVLSEGMAQAIEATTHMGEEMNQN